MAVDVVVRDLVRSYAELRDGATAQVNSASRLLQFYSVECGLKAAILGKNGSSSRSTQDLRDDPLHMGRHRRILRQARSPEGVGILAA